MIRSVAGGETGVSSVTLTLDGTKQYNMYRGGGATWATNLDGSQDVSVRFDVTYTDGPAGSVDGCFGGSWPVRYSCELFWMMMLVMFVCLPSALLVFTRNLFSEIFFSG